MCLQFPFVLIIVIEEVLNAKIQRLPTNSTNTLKFNDCRKKCHYGFLAVVAHFYFRNSNVIEKNRYIAVILLFLKKRTDRLFYQNSQSYLVRDQWFEPWTP